VNESASSQAEHGQIGWGKKKSSTGGRRKLGSSIAKRKKGGEFDTEKKVREQTMDWGTLEKGCDILARKRVLANKGTKRVRNCTAGRGLESHSTGGV